MPCLGMKQFYLWIGSSHTVCREENTVSLDGGHAGRMTRCLQEYEGGSTCRRVRWKPQMYKPLTQNIWVGCLVWCFDPRIIPGTSYKLRSIWAGPSQVTKLITQALAEIKPVYYP